MQDVKAQEGIGIHEIAAQQHEVNLVAEYRHGRCDIRSHRDRPICQLIPGQQVPGIAEQQRDQQQNNSDHPTEFAWRTIGAPIEHLKHVGEHQEHHGMRRPAVQIAQEQARGDDELQVFGVRVSLRH